jgi:hypothetical protein
MDEKKLCKLNDCEFPYKPCTRCRYYIKPSSQAPMKAEPKIILNANEICCKTGVQNCHACLDFNCGDNLLKKYEPDIYISFTAGAEAMRRECERIVKTIIPGNGILKLRALTAIKAVKEG